MAGVQPVLRHLELALQFQHQPFQPAGGQGPGDRLAGAGRAVHDAVEGQRLGAEPRRHRLARLDETGDAALRRLEGRQGFRRPAEADQIRRQLLGRNPFLRLLRPDLRTHQVEEGGLIVAEGGHPHQTIPSSTS